MGTQHPCSSQIQSKAPFHTTMHITTCLTSTKSNASEGSAKSLIYAAMSASLVTEPEDPLDLVDRDDLLVDDDESRSGNATQTFLLKAKEMVDDFDEKQQQIKDVKKESWLHKSLWNQFL